MDLKDYLVPTDKEVSYEAFESIVDIYKDIETTDDIDTSSIDKGIDVVTMYNTGFEDNKEAIVSYLNELAKDTDVKAFESNESDDEKTIGGKIKSVAIAVYRAIVDFIKNQFINITAFAKKLKNISPILKKRADNALMALNKKSDLNFKALESTAKDIDYLTAGQTLAGFYESALKTFIKASKEPKISTVDDVVYSGWENDNIVKISIKVDTPDGKRSVFAVRKDKAIVKKNDTYSIATMEQYKQLNEDLCSYWAKKGGLKELGKLTADMTFYSNILELVDEFIDAEKEISKRHFREDTHTAEELHTLKCLKEGIKVVKFIVETIPATVKNQLKIINIITK